jgi:flagellar biosynthesis/type III secretory pathway M-ring protein FliF/YscJ
LDSLFVRSWDNYLAAKEDQARQLTLKEFVDLTLKEHSTAPAAMDLDQITTDSPALAAFIADQVTKSTAKLRSQISHFQKTPGSAKNKPRGAPSSAHNTKKTDATKNNKKTTSNYVPKQNKSKLAAAFS